MEKPSPDKYMSPREFEVWVLAVNGTPEKEIATKLNISLKTVSVHKVKIARKRKERGLPPLRERQRQIMEGAK